MNLVRKLNEAKLRTIAWARGLNPVFPDEKEWKQKIRYRHSDLMIFECKDCGRDFKKKIVDTRFLWVKRLCPDCREAHRQSILAKLRTKSYQQIGI